MNAKEGDTQIVFSQVIFFFFLMMGECIRFLKLKGPPELTLNSKYKLELGEIKTTGGEASTETIVQKKFSQAEEVILSLVTPRACQELCGKDKNCIQAFEQQM